MRKYCLRGFIGVVTPQNLFQTFKSKNNTVSCVYKSLLDDLLLCCMLFQKYCLQCELRRGTYKLITFTTGCHLTVRKSQPSKKVNLTTGSGENTKLTKMFR